ncbi:MAG: methylase [Gammaproteobacteria bacterium HGW-Gammaproteobacteria-4]|nr:MAG: methylase [Gammaproteobacteria bacterium HGW-Gammaproteobacteria-4]
MSSAADKPHAPSTERNREPILAALREPFAGRRRVLEIGSGSGQHAVYFAAAPPPLALDVARGPWPAQRFDAVFSANTLHIMGWPAVQALFAGLPAVLADDAVLAIYGPFNRDGRYTSEGNAAFDAQLRAQDPAMGLRDAEAVDALALQAGLHLHADLPMPANNALRIWRTAPADSR